jgi:hypothetical protein
VRPDGSAKEVPGKADEGKATDPEKGKDVASTATNPGEMEKMRAKAKEEEAKRKEAEKKAMEKQQKDNQRRIQNLKLQAEANRPELGFSRAAGLFLRGVKESKALAGAMLVYGAYSDEIECPSDLFAAQETRFNAAAVLRSIADGLENEPGAVQQDAFGNDEVAEASNEKKG